MVKTTGEKRSTYLRHSQYFENKQCKKIRWLETLHSTICKIALLSICYLYNHLSVHLLNHPLKTQIHTCWFVPALDSIIQITHFVFQKICSLFKSGFLCSIQARSRINIFLSFGQVRDHLQTHTKWERNSEEMPPQTGDREWEPWGAATMELAETNPSVCAPLPPPLWTYSPCETIWCMYCCSNLSIIIGGGAGASYKARLLIVMQDRVLKICAKRCEKSFEGFMCSLIWIGKWLRL